MSASWTSVFKGIVDGHRVDCQTQTYYKVLYHQSEDEPGYLHHGGDGTTNQSPSTIIGSPTEAGTKIESEGATLEALREDLVENGFSDSTAAEITKKFSRA